VRRDSLPASLFQREENSSCPFEEGGWRIAFDLGGPARRGSLRPPSFQRKEKSTLDGLGAAPGAALYFAPVTSTGVANGLMPMASKISLG
jgi:hypothetical protein